MDSFESPETVEDTNLPQGQEGFAADEGTPRNPPVEAEAAEAGFGEDLDPDQLSRALLLDGQEEPEVDPQRRLIELETENRILREMRERGEAPAGQGTYSSGQDAIYQQEQALIREINELEASLPQGDSSQEQAQRYMVRQDITEKRIALQDLRQERLIAQQRSVQATNVLAQFKQGELATDPDLNNPAFLKAFDQYVKEHLPPQFQANEQALRMAWRDLAYRWQRLTRKQQQKLAKDGVGPRTGAAPKAQPKQAAPKLTEDQQRASRIYGLQAEEYDGRYGSPDDAEFDLGAFQFTHRRG